MLLTEGGKVAGMISSIQYRHSPIPLGGPVLFIFSYHSEPKHTTEVKDQDEPGVSLGEG